MSQSPTDLPRVLFLCVGNACRSPIGEGWLRHLAADRYRVSSAGITPIGVQPETVEVMAERGVDISDLRSSYVHHALGDPPDVLIALSRSALQACPPLPRTTCVLEWFVPDPYPVRGDDERRALAFRATRDEIQERIVDWLGGARS